MHSSGVKGRIGGRFVHKAAYIGPRVDEQSESNRVGEEGKPGCALGHLFLVRQNQLQVLVFLVVFRVTRVTLSFLLKQCVCTLGGVQRSVALRTGSSLLGKLKNRVSVSVFSVHFNCRGELLYL